MKNILTVISLFFVTLTYAQVVDVKGKVIDDTGEALPGATVIVKGTYDGTATDFDGTFSMQVAVGDTLEVSFIGFEPKDVVVVDQSFLEIQLGMDTQIFEEIVVVGYGTQKKKEVTGAVSVVNTKVLEELKPVDASQALQGTTSGVSVNSASGSPGSGYNITIRGVSSNGNNQPLFIIDGYEGSMNSINPDDIETITVLKDAQAAIYGIKGANGVVLVTTKAGRKNTAPKITYNGYYGTQETTKKLNYLNATEYAALLNESYAVNGQTIPFTDISGLARGTNWQNELFQQAPMMNNSIGVSGGGERVTYYVGASRLTQDGIIAPEKSNFERNNIKVNLGIDVTEKFKFTTNANYFYNERKSIAENGLGSVLFNALNYAPSYGRDEQDASGFLGNEVINPLTQIENTYNAYSGSSLEGMFQLDYKPIEVLTVTSRIGYKAYGDKNKNFAPIYNAYGPGKVFNRDRNEVNQSRTHSNSYTWETFATLKQAFYTDHNFTFTLGTSAQKIWGDGLFATGYDVPNNSWEFADLSLARGSSDALTNGSYIYDNRLTSYFGRVQYNYRGKYLLSAMLRRDGASDFAPENRVDLFSSATAGWVISEEDFFNREGIMDFMKIRASYGTLGNNTGGDLYRSLLSGEATYVLDGKIVTGVASGRLPNPNAKWETAKKLDIGLDMRFFKSKLDVVMDYFVEDREDLLIGGLPVSGILGTAAPGGGNPTINAGTTRSKGIEFAIGFKDYIGDDISYGINYNVTKVDGEVIAINGDVKPEGGSFSVGQLRPSRMEVGQPIGYFYGLKTDGIFQNQAEVEAHPSQAALGSAAAPGDIRYVDTNGDGVINFDDRTYLGKPQADYFMGLNLNLNFKGFDVSTYLYSEIGKEMIRNYERDQPNVNRLNLYLDRWTGEGTSNYVPRTTVGATSNKTFSDFYVEDASFLRMQNIQLGYTLPVERLESIGLEKLRIYTSIKNPFTLTEYRGYDPAASTGQAIGGGIDYGFYPIARQYLVGLNITL